MENALEVVQNRLTQGASIMKALKLDHGLSTVQYLNKKIPRAQVMLEVFEEIATDQNQPGSVRIAAADGYLRNVTPKEEAQAGITLSGPVEVKLGTPSKDAVIIE